MNERIQELAAVADQLAEDELVHLERVHNRLYSFTEGREIYNQKLAELIVAECMEVCRRGKYDGRDDLSLIQFNNGIRFCMNAIDEHFGD